ncbi:MAG: ketopantoate reductase family protein [Alphaproteobacteria bacterium]|nr:ketopantoate reductase family protein [Alphaproteobacteria bacterium]
MVDDDPILIWGAGAIGGTIGAYWVRAGQKVVFVDIVPEHVEAIRGTGLALEGPVENFSVIGPAFLPKDLHGKYNRIVLAVKAQHTEQATRALLPHLAEDGYVLSAQNGLNELTIARIAGERRTMGCFVNFGADYLAPGRVLFGGRGAVVVGEIDGKTTERVRKMHALLKVFEPNAVLTDNIWGYLWGKLGYGALLFATALTNESIADALASPRHFDLYRRLAGEVMAVAKKKGIKPLGFNGYEPEAFMPGASEAATRASIDAMVAHNRGSAKTHSGIWRDLAVRKRKTEIDAQIAIVGPIAREVGVQTPALNRLVGLIHDIEDGKRPMSLETLDALAAETC